MTTYLLAAFAAVALLFGAAPAAHAQLPVRASAAELARFNATGWDTSHAGEPVTLAGYQTIIDVIPSDSSKVGYDDGVTIQPGVALYAYNNVEYFDSAGNGYYMVPGSSAASGWSGHSPLTFSTTPGPTQGVTVTLSHPGSNWQSAVLKTYTTDGHGYAIGYGAILEEISIPTYSGPLYPDVAAWSKTWAPLQNGRFCWDEDDWMETHTNLNASLPGLSGAATGYSASRQVSTYHRWPGNCAFGPVQAQSHNAQPYAWTATVQNTTQWYGVVRTPTSIIIVNDLILGGGNLTEVARRPIFDVHGQTDPMFGLFDVGTNVSLSGVDTSASAAATLNRIVMKSCTPATC